MVYLVTGQIVGKLQHYSSMKFELSLCTVVWSWCMVTCDPDEFTLRFELNAEIALIDYERQPVNKWEFVRNLENWMYHLLTIRT